METADIRNLYRYFERYLYGYFLNVNLRQPGICHETS